MSSRMQKLFHPENVGRLVGGNNADVFAPIRAVFAQAANQQATASNGAGFLPDSEDGDLAKVEVKNLTYSQIEDMIEAYRDTSAPAVDAITAARIDDRAITNAKRDGLAAIERDNKTECVYVRKRAIGTTSRKCVVTGTRSTTSKSGAGPIL